MSQPNALTILTPALRACARLGFLLLLTGACAGSQRGSDLQCREEEGRQRCVTTGGAGEALVTGAAAGALWGAEGCKIAGCQPPLECNYETERCQPMRCGEDLRDCPPGYHCEMKTRTCR